jgi:hypothetical protein
VTSFQVVIVKPAVARTELVSSGLSKKLVPLLSAHGTGKWSSGLVSAASASKKASLPPDLKDAPELTVNLLSILNIHHYMLGPHDVETAVRKGQSQKVTGLIADQGV